MFERRVAASTEAVSLSLQTVFSILTLKKLKCWSFTARGRNQYENQLNLILFS